MPKIEIGKVNKDMFQIVKMVRFGIALDTVLLPGAWSAVSELQQGSSSARSTSGHTRVHTEGRNRDQQPCCLKRVKGRDVRNRHRQFCYTSPGFKVLLAPPRDFPGSSQKEGGKV